MALPLDPGEARMPVDELAEGGRGLALAATVASLAYERVAEGNVWTIVRRRS